MPNDITIDGYNFNEGVTAEIQKAGSSHPLTNVTRVNSTRVQAVVPSSLDPGVYDAVLRNAGQTDAGRLSGAYSIFSSSNDDFFVGPDDIWTNPTTVRKGDTVQLGLNLHRRGGKKTVQAPVRFYLGQPGAGGIPIGDVTSEPIVPQPVEKDPDPVYVSWAVGDREGAVTIYAVVDPASTITETTKLNNQASRSLTILPAAADTTAPEVTNLVLAGGAAQTSNPVLSAALTASDNAGGSGVARMYLVEKEFNPAARAWVSIQKTDWITYTSPYNLTLTDRAGLRYIQAYVADGAGNISLNMVKRQINYVASSDSLRANQVRLYRRTLAVGSSLSVRVEPISGDADLWVWDPRGNSALVRNASGTAVDEGSFTAAVAGVYQIEVFAYSDTTYRMTISGGQAAELGVASTEGPAVQLNAEKTARTAPVVAAENEPEGQSAVPAAPVGEVTSSGVKVYLPMLARQSSGGW